MKREVEKGKGEGRGSSLFWEFLLFRSCAHGNSPSLTPQACSTLKRLLGSHVWCPFRDRWAKRMLFGGGNDHVKWSWVWALSSHILNLRVFSKFENEVGKLLFFSVFFFLLLSWQPSSSPTLPSSLWATSIPTWVTLRKSWLLLPQEAMALFTTSGSHPIFDHISLSLGPVSWYYRKDV